jgi:EAL domain-containing protein (putative c-di-GMP-specific phosphodiesterase class I)
MNRRSIGNDEVEAALNNGELCFHYHPKVSFLTGGIVGAEALLRWVRPDGTMIPPGDFLPEAERTGFITDITAIMLPELIEDIERLRAIKPDIQVAYNVSALDLRSPYLTKMLRAFIGDKRIGPGNIQIEITETAVLDDSVRIKKSLLDLVALGIEIVMDDYGTGYSSLDVLSRLPFSALKLDQGVVRRMSKDAKNTHIVSSSLDMARELSIKTVAEGVETEGVYAFLMASGCNEVQGYWICEPMPLDDFIELLESGRSWPSSSLGLLHSAWLNHLSYRRKVLDAVQALTMIPPDEWGNLPRTDLSHSPARCRLGQWYLNESHQLTDSAEFRRLEEPHRMMHAAGEALVKAAKSGAQADEIRRRLKAFLDYSDVVDSEVSRIVERWMGRVLPGTDAASDKAS